MPLKPNKQLMNKPGNIFLTSFEKLRWTSIQVVSGFAPEEESPSKIEPAGPPRSGKFAEITATSVTALERQEVDTSLTAAKSLQTRLPLIASQGMNDMKIACHCCVELIANASKCTKVTT
ncbi:hypothetical protein OS493_011085 [Desmophyllum pertusum]|uniref:Uncharacterized protein n=1 Tax=Desmophyllum pertusum TaxID=174260 RepID=A0A9W9Z362_9CNID|nr:hypothetical protein OS493_011085 [Desmophyllum pertusum]